MPVYNVEDYIDKAIKSVLEQNYADFELIIVDDGSVDGTGAIAKSYAEKDNRVVVIQQANSGKPSIARNAGIKIATGDFISFLDGDDIYLPGRIKEIIDIFKLYPDADVVINDLNRMSTDSVIRTKTYLHEFDFPGNAKGYLHNSNASPLIYECTDNFYNFLSAIFCSILMPTITVRKRRLIKENIYFREDLRCGEDIDLWFRLVYDSKVIYLDKPLCAYRYHEASTTQDKEDFYLGTIESHLSNLKRGDEVLSASEKKHYRHRISDRYQHLAYWYFENNRMHNARKSYFKALSLYFDLKIIIRIMKTFIPKSIISLRNKLRG